MNKIEKRFSYFCSLVSGWVGFDRRQVYEKIYLSDCRIYRRIVYKRGVSNEYSTIKLYLHVYGGPEETKNKKGEERDW